LARIDDEQAMPAQKETLMSRDPFTLEIVKDALVAIGHEMFDAMIRTSMSPIV
jgi:hypothetical protein